jgi:hypothetical protein
MARWQVIAILGWPTETWRVGRCGNPDGASEHVPIVEVTEWRTTAGTAAVGFDREGKAWCNGWKDAGAAP